MLRFKLLGTLVIERGDGTTVAEVPRRAMAVLAVIAAASGRPVSRDTLLGYFWSESDAERARHRLSDSLSLLRSVVPEGTILATRDTLRLNPERATTDVARFEAAMTGGQPEQAVAAWGGPFLDGFFVAGASGFEHWMDGERNRLARLYARALTTLAEATEARGAAADAVAWWRRLAAHDPLDSAVALRVIGALRLAGDEAGAVRHAQGHAVLLREELGIEPPRGVAAVLEQGRARPATAAGAADVGTMASEPPVADAAVLASAPPAPTRGPASRRRLAPGRASVLVGTAVLVLVAGWWTARRGESAVMGGAELIAVLPFTTSGEGMDVLREGMVDLLSSNLDQVGAVRTVSPRTALQQWHRTTGGQEADLAAALAVGSALEAGSVLIGSVVSAGGRARMDAELHRVRGGLLARARVEGSPDSVLALADQLSLALLREIWQSTQPIPTARLSAVTTASFPALRSYLRGTQFYRTAQWDSAAIAYETAIRHDSTFALAFARLSEVDGWRRTAAGTSQIIASADAALRHADRLPERERTLIRARRLFHDRNPAVVDSMHAYRTRYPDDLLGHYYSADMAYHANPVIGFDLEEFFAAFDRVIERDSTFGPTYHHPIEVALTAGDRPRFLNYLAALGRASPNDPRLPFFRDAERHRWSPPAIAGRDLLRDVRAGRIDALAPMTGVLAAATLGADAPRPDDYLLYLRSAPMDAHAPLVRALAGLGRLHAAERALAGRAAPDWDNGIGPVVLGYATRDYAERVQRGVAARDPPAVLRVLTALHGGDAAAARVELVAARLAPRTGPAMSDGLFRALAGWTDVLAGDTARGAAAMRAGLRDVGFEDERARFTYPVRLQLALLDALHPATHDAAFRAIGLLRTSPGNLIVFPYGMLVTARVFERAGQPAAAAAAYRRFAVLFAGADAELQPLVANALRAAARLETAAR
ncbi:MAG: BTAD domain-containing putative transcriptional regulator [Gemmatimonadaceae bacterium]